MAPESSDVSGGLWDTCTLVSLCLSLPLTVNKNKKNNEKFVNSQQQQQKNGYEKCGKNNSKRLPSEVHSCVPW